MKKILITILTLTTASICLAEIKSEDCSPSAHRNELQQSIKWYRNSAEKNAVYRQVYSQGTEYVKNWVSHHHPKLKSWGVVIDIDETTLNNCWYFRKCLDVADNESDFEHFVSIPNKSIALPGVVKFTQAVHQLGGYVSFVTNRDGSYRDKTGNVLARTIANLKQAGVEFDQVILANYKNSSHPTDKNPRFNAVINGIYDHQQMVWSNKLPPHPVIAYFGDNIQDFPHFKQSTLIALSADDKEFDLFGHGYFILPNPMYGSWEKNEFK